jgi:hypothetical protein
MDNPCPISGWEVHYPQPRYLLGRPNPNIQELMCTFVRIHMPLSTFWSSLLLPLLLLAKLVVYRGNAM